MNDPNRTVEDLWVTLDAADLNFVHRIDSERLVIERERLPERRRESLKSPTYGLKNRFDMWETLIRKMENEWDSSGYYLIDEYLNDLTSRSVLSEILRDAPQGTRERMEETLAFLDKRFFEQTIFDRGEELGRWRSAKPSTIIDFLWERRPINIPWDH